MVKGEARKQKVWLYPHQTCSLSSHWVGIFIAPTRVLLGALKCGVIWPLSLISITMFRGPPLFVSYLTDNITIIRRTPSYTLMFLAGGTFGKMSTFGQNQARISRF